jgi:glycosyltransferase involved in cell wall biosynthesis
MKGISVVIPVYFIDEESVQMTRNCLHSLKAQMNELIVVDDASLYPTEEFKHISYIYHRNEKNLGYIKSANIGFKHARYDHIVLVCNDTELLSGHLKDLCGEGYRFPVVEGKEKPFWDGSFYGFPKKIKGLYDERYINYFGDVDKFYSAKIHKIPLEITSTVRIRHLQSATTKKAGVRESDYAHGLESFKKKWGVDPLEDYYTFI